ncbi:hypothetical protein [Thalassolituus sp.]|uniref:hypothetical protein n=2 Tax=Thalassolituus sp. TaxID=2030822 RepID=UPI003513B4C4
MMNKWFVASAIAASTMSGSALAELDWSLEAGVEGRRFIESGAFAGQVDDQWSLTVQPELVWDTDSGNSRFTFVPFYRKDFADDERTHGDIREAMFMIWRGPWELRAGIGKVFWGVTESLHLVDVINQTDFVEAIDGDQKLGQPMIQGIWLADSGTWEAFILPGFRERTFPGEAGRYRAELLVSDDAEYQASEEQQHVDLAARWSLVTELNGYPLDLTASVFRGTSRDPLLVPQVEVVNSVLTLTELVPYYAIQNQIGSTLQFAPEGWLLKAEMIYRDYQIDELPGVGEVKDQFAAVGGFEYTLVGPFGDAADLGLLAEYQYDSRGSDYSDAQNDLFVGTRYVFNDMASSEVLAGFTQDLDFGGTRLFLVEANTRLNPSTTLDVTMTLVTAEDDSLASVFRRDDTVEVALNFFF